MASASILISWSMRCTCRTTLMRLPSPAIRRKRHRYYSTNKGDDALSMSIRALMRSSAQPVAVITALIGNAKGDINSTPSASHAHGATLSSFSTISLDPPLLAFSLRTPSRMADALRANSTKGKANFIINILSDKQEVEASGFSKGIKSFALSQDWNETLERDFIDKQNPLSSAPFHPSQYAQDSKGVAVPVLSDSIGALACSIVSVISLRGSKEGRIDDRVTHSALESDRGSELFIAKIHGVESDMSSTSQTRRLPMVYWDQQFKSVK